MNRDFMLTLLSKMSYGELACSAGVFWVGETLFVFVDSGRLGRVEIVTLTVGARAKEGKGGGGGEKKILSLPAPSPLPLTRPISSSLREVSTWRFREQIARSKKTPALQANGEL